MTYTLQFFIKHFYIARMESIIKKEMKSSHGDVSSYFLSEIVKTLLG